MKKSELLKRIYCVKAYRNSDEEIKTIRRGLAKYLPFLIAKNVRSECEEQSRLAVESSSLVASAVSFYDPEINFIFTQVTKA